MFEAVQNIPGDLSLTLWGENLNRPVGMSFEHISNIAIVIKRYPLPGKHRYIWHNRSSAEVTPQFWEKPRQFAEA